MIIENEVQLTQAVLDETRRTEDPRLKEILQSLITHLHAFAREVRLTEREFDQAIGLVARLGQLTTESHNEVRLMAGSLGLSALVCLINNGEETTANLLGPFWRAGAPMTPNGGSIVRSPTPGTPLFFTGHAGSNRPGWGPGSRKVPPWRRARHRRSRRSPAGPGDPVRGR